MSSDYEKSLEKQNEELQAKLAKYQSFYANIDKHTFIVKSVNYDIAAPGRLFYNEEYIVIGLHSLSASVKHLKHQNVFPGNQLGFQISRPRSMIYGNKIRPTKGIEYNFTLGFEYIDIWEYNKATRAWEVSDRGYAMEFDTELLEAVGNWHG
jgi:hypothetical protein